MHDISRRPLYLGSSVLFFACTLVCGFSDSAATLIILRLFSGVSGSSCLSVGATTNFDLFQRQQLGKAMSLTPIILLIGLCIGPVLGAAVTQSLGWRWVFYILGSTAGFNVVLVAFVLKETHKLTILRIRAKRMPPNADQRTDMTADDPESCMGLSYVRRAALLPLKLLFQSPVVILSCLSDACIYSVLYLILTTMPFVFRPYYGFSEQQTGLIYLAPGVGLLLGLIIFGLLSDRIAIAQSKKSHAEQHKPEARLSLAFACPGLVLTVAGLFVYGWTAEYHTHWALPVTGIFIFGSGMLLTTSPALVYLMDCFPKHAASVNAANAFLRSIFTGLLPLCGIDMFDSLGSGRSASLLAGVVASAVAINLLCRALGPELRDRFPLMM